MITCTCAVRGPERCPHHRTYADRSMAGLDTLTARAVAPPLADPDPALEPAAPGD